jgi:hypothetical protein
VKTSGFDATVRTGLVALALATAGLEPVVAQRYGSGLREVGDMGSAGINLAVAVPVGEFDRNVNVAGGLDVFGALSLGRGGALAIRLDGSYLIYGHENRFLPQPFYPVAVNTTYSIATFGVGPQLTLGRGPVRLYGFGTFGASYISARSSYRVDGCGCDAFASQTDFDDWQGALQGGGGLLIALRTRHTPVSIDLGARYLYNGDSWYVSPGGVNPQPNGSVLIDVNRTPANLVVMHLGVSVGIR